MGLLNVLAAAATGALTAGPPPSVPSFSFLGQLSSLQLRQLRVQCSHQLQLATYVHWSKVKLRHASTALSASLLPLLCDPPPLPQVRYSQPFPIITPPGFYDVTLDGKAGEEQLFCVKVAFQVGARGAAGSRDSVGSCGCKPPASQAACKPGLKPCRYACCHKRTATGKGTRSTAA
jgi:hypothetical protein